MRNFTFIFILIFCFIIQLPVFGQQVPDSEYQHVDTIYVRDFEFSPDTLTITAGDSIVFAWESGDHTTSSHYEPSGAASWHQPINAQHPFWLVQLTKPGEYHYHSMDHQGLMTGVIIVEEDADVVSVFDNIETEKYLQSVYPNPASDIAIFKINTKGQDAVLRISNIIGEQIEKIIVKGSGDTEVNVSQYTEGLYLYSIEINSKRKVTGKLIISR